MACLRFCRVHPDRKRMLCVLAGRIAAGDGFAGFGEERKAALRVGRGASDEAAAVQRTETEEKRGALTHPPGEGILGVPPVLLGYHDRKRMLCVLGGAAAVQRTETEEKRGGLAHPPGEGALGGPPALPGAS